jgi:MFS family permease
LIGQGRGGEAPIMANSADADTAPSTGFGWYLFAHGSWFLVFGVQSVLFTYLVRAVLHEDAIRFGFAQMSMQLPTTILILVGGFVADHTDRKRLMIGAYAAAAAVFVGLGALVAGGSLSYALVIAYALIIGTISAFAMPARDSLLSHITPKPGVVLPAVAVATLVQFGGQLLGLLLASQTSHIGVVGLLFSQAGLLAVAGTMAALKVQPRRDDDIREQRGSNLLAFMASQIGGGFRAAIASPVVAPVLVCNVGMGVCFFGAFAVLLPLVVQGYYPDVAGKADPRIAAALSAFTGCFWIGAVASTLALMRFGSRLPRRGALYLAALVAGSLVLALCALPMPLWLLCALNFVWGLGGGVAMTLGRGLVQEAAPAAARARVLSIFTLGQMGGAPVGAVAYGFLAHDVGARVSILIPAAGMFAIAASVALFSGLARPEQAPAAQAVA